MSSMNQLEEIKPKLYVVGAVAGAAVGLATAFMIARAAEENDGQLEITTSDIFKIGLTVFNTVRGVAAIGAAV